MEVKELIQNGLENVKRGVDRTLDSLTPAELKWQPRPDANCIGLILFHMIRTEDSSIHSRLQGKSQLWESEKWYQKLNKAITDDGAHYTPEQVAGFVVPDLEDLMAYAEAVRKQTLEYIQGLKPGDFDKKVNLPPPPVPRNVPAGRPAPPRMSPVVGSILLMLVTHLSQHVGEISYLRGLQRGMDK